MEYREKELLKGIAACLGVASGCVVASYGMRKNMDNLEQTRKLYNSTESSIDDVLITDEITNAQLTKVYTDLAHFSSLEQLTSGNRSKSEAIAKNLHTILSMYDPSNTEHKSYLTNTLQDTRNDMRMVVKSQEGASNQLYAMSFIISAALIGVCGGIALKKVYNLLKG